MKFKTIFSDEPINVPFILPNGNINRTFDATFIDEHTCLACILNRLDARLQTNLVDEYYPVVNIYKTIDLSVTEASTPMKAVDTVINFMFSDYYVIYNYLKSLDNCIIDYYPFNQTGNNIYDLIIVKEFVYQIIYNIHVDKTCQRRLDLSNKTDSDLDKIENYCHAMCQILINNARQIEYLKDGIASIRDISRRHLREFRLN